MRERGNILFLILLAVVLFAALSYAVTSSMKGGGKDVSDEKAAAVAAQIINTIGLQEPELIRFMERTKRKIHEIDFIGPHNTAGGGSGNSPNCSATSCDLWSANGGGVTQPIIPPEAYNPDATYTSCTLGGSYRPTTLNGAIRPFAMVIGASGVGTSASDLVLLYSCIHPKICAEINIQEGLRGRSEAAIVGAPFAGHYSDLQASSATALASTTANSTAGSEPRLMSRRVWCRETDMAAGGVGGILYAVIYAQ